MQKLYKGGALALLALGGMMQLQAQTTSPSGSSIYGFLGYTEKHDRNGWYAISPEGDMELLWLDEKLIMSGTYFTSGWIRDNKVCGLYGNASKLLYLEFDFNTGENVTERVIDISGDKQYRYMLTAAYNPTDDYIYGFSFNADRSIDYLVKAPAADPEKAEIIRVMPPDFMLCKSVCYNVTDNHFYGIDGMNGIIRFDVYGNFEYLGDVDLPRVDNMAGWSSGMVYSPKDKCFFWDAQYAEFDSDFVRIDPTTYHCEILKAYPFLDQITFMCCNDDDGMPGGPAAGTLKDYGFEGTSTSGTIVYTMPTAMSDGSEMPAELTWTATEIPGGQTYTGTAAPGEEVTVEYKDLQSGEHTFSFYASTGDLRGASVFTNTWVGIDAPYVPENVKISEKDANTFEVTWNPVTRGAHGTSLEGETISYGVFLNGEQKLITKECRAEIEFDGEAPNKPFIAQVVAIVGGVQSEAGYSNQIIAGSGYSLPFVVTPSEEEARLMTVINVDDDKSGWRYYVLEGDQTFYTGRDYDNPGNDWLITPKLVFPSDASVYSISFEACCHASNFNEEYFEIWASQENTAEGMIDIRVAPRTQVSLQSWEEFKYDFEVDAAGGYYVGIHSISAADQRGWYIRNLSIIEKESGIDQPINLLANAAGSRGEILLNGLEGATADIFAADGRKVASLDCRSNSERIQVQAGIYIVKAGKQSWKVAVK